MNRINKYIIPLTFIIISILTNVYPAYALSISPFSYTGNLLPGDSTITYFTVTNDTDNPVHIKTSIAEIFYSDSGEQVNLSPTAGSSAYWLKIPQEFSEFVLDPESAQTIAISVEVPKNASSGAYYPVVVVKEDNNSDRVGNQTGLEASLGYRFAINVVGDLPERTVEITDLQINKIIIGDLVIINYSIFNAISQFTKPIGYIQIIDTHGNPVWREVINSDLDILQPGGYLSGEIAEEINLVDDIFKTGMYKLQLLVVDEQFKASNFYEVTFFVIPPSLILITLGGVLVAVLATLKYRRRNRN